MAASLLTMDKFVYNTNTVNRDWPIWKQLLNNYLMLQDISTVVVAADLTATTPVVGDTTAKALGHLLHAGGSMILEIYNTSPTNPPLTYPSFVAILDARFAETNQAVADYYFRACFQNEQEPLKDYVMRLKALGTKSGIASNNLEKAVLSVVRHNTDNHELRLKGLDDTTTLESLLTWEETHNIKSSAATKMEASKSSNSNTIHNINQKQGYNSSNQRSYSQRPNEQRPFGPRNNDQRQQSKPHNRGRNGTYDNNNSSQNECFNCGGNYPHIEMCPAYGKSCNKCGKMNHLAAKCKKFPSNTSATQSNARHSLMRYQSSNQSQQRNQTASQNNQIRQIDELSEEDLIEEFIAYYQQRQTPSNTQPTHSPTQNTNIRMIRELNPHNSELDIEFINELTNEQILKCPRTYIQIGRSKLSHLVDTGTCLNIISKSTYKNMRQRPLLRRTSTLAYGFHSKTQIPLLGEFTTIIKFRHRSTQAKYLVLDGEAEDIIGYTTATLLGIVHIECDNDPNYIYSIGNVQTARSTNHSANYVDKHYIDPRVSHPSLFTHELGQLKHYRVTLEVDKSIKPCQQPAYPVPFGLLELSKAKIEYLEANDVITRHNGEKLTWISPAQFVGKFRDDGTLADVRVTCNAKQLNKALIPVKRHIPSITELTNELAGAEWFSKLDFKDAFNQVLLDEESRCLTAMATIWGVYLWNCLNMGISTASELFQDTMEKLFIGIPNIKIALDDVLIFTETKEQHHQILAQCLERIEDSGMTLNSDKCAFVKNEVVFFGTTISKNGVAPKKSTYEDLQNCLEPTTTKEVQSFLGLTGYFKTRTPYQSTIDKPLRKLIRKGAVFKFEEEERNAYKELKRGVIEESMAFFNHKLETELYVDAGPDGCSSFLTQLMPNGDIKLVRCDSHTFTDAERRYSHLEKEAFACVWACKANHLYVYGRAFKCITDALAVKKIFEEDKIRKRTPIRFIRWKSDLSVYNVTFVHRAGSKNIADYLSRRFKREHVQIQTTTPISYRCKDDSEDLEQYVNNIVEACVPTEISMEQLVEATNNDNQITEVKNALKLKHLGNKIDQIIIKPFKLVMDELSVSSHGLLLRNDVIVIPEKLREPIIKYAHEGHIGSKLVKRLLRNICWFPAMDTLIDDAIRDCIQCQANVDNTTKEPIIPSSFPEDSWHTLAIDFGSGPNGEYNLGVYDEYSRKTLQELSKDLTSKSAIRICQRFFKKYGIPKVIKSDNGPAFISKEFAEFAKKYNFQHRKVTPLHPAANGSIERTMRNNNKVIRCALVGKQPWKIELQKWLKRYNQTPHTSTGFSPNLLLHGSDNCNIIPILNPKRLTEKIKQTARANDEKAKMKMKMYADAYQNVKHREFAINDAVLNKWARTHKFQSLFDPNPYRVSKIKGTMITSDRDNHQITRNSQFFKIITEKCYENARKLQTTQKTKTAIMSAIVQMKQVSNTSNAVVLNPDQGAQAHSNNTPPPTPITQQQQQPPQQLLRQQPVPSQEMRSPSTLQLQQQQAPRSILSNPPAPMSVEQQHRTLQQPQALGVLTTASNQPAGNQERAMPPRESRKNKTVDYTQMYKMYPKILQIIVTQESKTRRFLNRGIIRFGENVTSVTNGNQTK